mgnify:CR=1 FL=1
MINNDTELKEMLLGKLERGEKLGFSWRSRLNWLRENGYINDDQLQNYKDLHEKSAEKANSELAQRQAEQIAASRPVPCSVCGDVINAGTYGYIYNSLNSPYNVIKGSIKGHSITYGCPSDFEHEVVMYQKIYPIFQEIKSSNLVSLLDIKNKFIENRRCYYEMDKIFPYLIDETLRQKIQAEIGLLNGNNRYFLQTFLNMNTLTMLTPGFTDKDYFSSGGNENSSWFELGEDKIKMLFSLLDISYDEYCESLILLLQSTLRKNIILTDVEFMLGSINTGEGFRNGIFMIDFDKVEEKTTRVESSEIRNLLVQDMFPDKVRSFFSTFYQKKYLKYKKKYVNLKNKINVN